MPEKETPMNLPKGTNINTIVSAAGFLVLLGGIVWTEGRSAEQLAATQASLASYRAATDLRIARLETDTRQIDNLNFRMQAAESANASVGRVLDELQSAVSQQSGDIRVVREILQRLERQGQTSALRSFPMAAESSGEL